MRFAALLSGAHALALAAVLGLPAHGLLRAALAVGVVASAVFYLRRDALLRLPVSIVKAVLDGGGLWHLSLRDGQELEARLEPGAFVQPYLIALTFRVGARRRRSLVLWPDSASPDALRQLRVRLRAG